MPIVSEQYPPGRDRHTHAVTPHPCCRRRCHRHRPGPGVIPDVRRPGCPAPQDGRHAESVTSQPCSSSKASQLRGRHGRFLTGQGQQVMEPVRSQCGGVLLLDGRTNPNSPCRRRGCKSRIRQRPSQGRLSAEMSPLAGGGRLVRSPGRVAGIHRVSINWFGPSGPPKSAAAPTPQ